MMSVEAAPKALIWKNDTSSSKKDRKVSHLRYVSTIHSLTSPMQRHHPNRRQSYHQLDKKHQQHLQPRQRSRYHRHSRAGYNDQPTQRRRGAAGKRSTTGTIKRNSDKDSKTNTSQRLTSTHAEQSLKVSDSPLESRNGIAIAHQKKNSLSYQLRRVFYGSATSTKQCNHGICTTPRRMTQTFIANRYYTNHNDAEACGDRGHTHWQRSYSNMIPMTRDDADTNVAQMITYSSTTRTHFTNI